MKRLHLCISACLLAVFTLGLFSACTRNDGDIGDYFGTWHIESLQQDGSSPAAYDGSAFVQFQNTIVCVRATDALHNERADYGTWAENGNTLTLTFPDPNVYYDRVLGTLADGPVFAPDQATFQFTIADRSSRSMTLQIPDLAGNSWTFTLKKQ